MALLKRGRLCETCLAIFNVQTTVEEDFKTGHHTTYASLDSAANTGCYVCIRLRIRVDLEEKQPPDFQPLLFSVHQPDTNNACDLTFLVEVAGARFFVKFLIMAQDDWPQLQMVEELPRSIRDVESVRQAKSWLLHCREHHAACRATQRKLDKTPLPTRLVFIQSAKGNLHVCIKETASMYDILSELDTEYLSLSHAWGKDRFLTLTSRNYEAFSQNIEIQSLSRVFQDAIFMTHQLGFHYIWIDSLCIIQDDPQDWQREALRMAMVYQNAVLNLSASGFESGIDGFLPATRQPEPLPPIVHSDGHLVKGTCIISDQLPWRTLWGAPLFCRAWVLQEQILAARAMHFGRDQMHWECQTRYANEVFPNGWSSIDSRSTTHTLTETPFEKLYHGDHALQLFWHFCMDSDTNLLTSTSPDLFKIWTSVVQDYSLRQLTFRTDRVPALSGLVTAFYALLPERQPMELEYLSGLWKRDIARQLLWREMPVEHKPDEQPNTQVHPSWSWLSSDVPIEWHDMASTSTVTVTVTVTSPHLATLLEHLPATTLHLQGWPLDFRHATDYIWTDNTFGTDISTPNLLVHFPSLPCPITYHPDHWFVQRAHIHTDDCTALLRYLVSSTLLFPLTCVPDAPPPSGSVSCVLLWRDTALGQGTYHRVGTARMHGESEALVTHATRYRDAMPRDDVVRRVSDGSCVVAVA